MTIARRLALPPDPSLSFWLQAHGSLTARLRRHGVVEVRVQKQGAMPLWRAESADLQVPVGYVREVVLLLDGRAVVWARSATPLPAIRGAWRAMRGLGARPLAELLFDEPGVDRGPLRAHRLARRGPADGHIRRQWWPLTEQTLPADAPRWARSSVFWRQGQPLRVMEAFSPWVRSLCVGT